MPTWVFRSLLLGLARQPVAFGFWVGGLQSTGYWRCCLYSQSPSKGSQRSKRISFVSKSKSPVYSKPRSDSKPNFKSLAEPQVLFSNNHLLLVNKPAGWHSVPNDSRDNNSTNKCLLAKLKLLKLGGGSQADFLLPMHRIDQPCTGALLFAKNKKAATRITTAWKKGQVTKEYWCVVKGSLQTMKANSIHSNSSYQVTGILFQSTTTTNNNSRSVICRASKSPQAGQRFCELQWNTIKSLNGGLELIRVKTSTGAKHQVRAMLAQLLNSPVAGDLRYGPKDTKPLPDQSVALHARSIFLPTVQLGGTPQLQTDPFIAPIPNTWKEFFALDESNLKKVL